MKKLITFTMVFALVGLFSFMFMGSVMAYEEGDWGSETCLTVDDWLTSAKSEYNFDSSSGKYTISGMTAQEYRSAQDVEPVVVFYGVSSDGKTLTAYVPSYNGAVNDEETFRPMLEDAGISTEYSCSTTIKVSKTVSGETPDDPSDPSDDPSDPSDDPSQNCMDGYTWDSGAGKCVADANKKTQTEDSPNTASPASIVGTAIGAALVLVAVYVFLNKDKKINFKKKNNK